MKCRWLAGIVLFFTMMAGQSWAGDLYWVNWYYVDTDTPVYHDWRVADAWRDYDTGALRIPTATDNVFIDLAIPGSYVQLSGSATIIGLSLGTEYYYSYDQPADLRIVKNGILNTTKATIGGYYGVNAVMTLNGASSWTNAENILIDMSGATGLLSITEAATVSNGDLRLSGEYGGHAYLNIDGKDSRMVNSGSLSAFGASIAVSDGGYLSNGNAVFSGNDNYISITGRGQWVNNGDLDLSGNLDINSDGSVSVFGNNTTVARASVAVDGGGSAWHNSGDLDLGNSSLSITHGATVTSRNASVAANSNVLVSGNGARWNTSGDLAFAGTGSASLRVENGGHVSVGGVLHTAANAGAVADIEVNPGASLSAGRLVIGQGTTNLRLNGSSNLGSITTDIPAQAIDLAIGDGVNAASMTLNNASQYTGTTTINFRAQAVLNNSADFSASAVVNNGNIRFGGSGGKTLVIQDYTAGNGAMLYMNAMLAGDNSVVDKLVLPNGVNSGVTQVSFVRGGGQGGKITDDSIHVVEIGPGGSNPNGAGSFVTGKPMVSGLYIYDIAYEDGSAGNGEYWYLTSTKYVGAGGAILNTVGATSMAWFTQMDNVSKRMGEIRFQAEQTLEDYILGQNKGGELGVDFWVRAYGRQANVNLGISGVNGFTDYLYGIDIGADKTWRIDGNNALSVGYFMGYGGAQRDFKYGGSEGETGSYYAGLYGTWVNKDGWYADLVTKGQYFDNSYDTYGLFDDHGSYNSWGAGVSLEIGKRFQFKNGYFVEPSVQASYVRLFNESYTTREYVDIGLTDADIAQFWGGVRTGWTFKVHENGSTLQPYLKVGAIEQISSGGKVQIGGDAGDVWRPNTDGLHGVGGAGLVFQMTEVDQLHLDYEALFGDKYDVPWNLNFGYRHQF
jgi:outer membrane autotransporter protein